MACGWKKKPAAISRQRAIKELAAFPMDSDACDRYSRPDQSGRKNMIQKVAQRLGLASRATPAAKQERSSLRRFGFWMALAALAWLAIGLLAGWDLPPY